MRIAAVEDLTCVYRLPSINCFLQISKLSVLPFLCGVIEPRTPFTVQFIMLNIYRDAKISTNAFKYHGTPIKQVFANVCFLLYFSRIYSSRSSHSYLPQRTPTRRRQTDKQASSEGAMKIVKKQKSKHSVGFIWLAVLFHK